MDYCSTCRRHLNGALVCPGCGAYAPDIAPPIVAPRDLALRDCDEPSPSPSPSPAPLDSPDLAGVVPPVPLPAPQGRAARRRQLARWKKNQRRAVVATAVALVGGGLTVASLDRQTGDRTQAATAPELPTTYGGEETASDHTLPAVTGSDAHRSTPSSTSPSPSRANNRPDSLAAAPKHPGNPPTAASVPRQRTGTSSYDGRVTTPTAPTDAAGTADTADTAAGTTGQQPPAPAANDGTQSSTSTSSSSTSTSTSTSQTGSAPAATSPSNVCVLGLICL